LNNTNITQLDFTLTNSKNELLDFNGVDWSMTVFCSQVDDPSASLLDSQGTFNTPFQNQLSVLEGTAQAEAKAKRQRTQFK